MFDLRKEDVVIKEGKKHTHTLKPSNACPKKGQELHKIREMIYSWQNNIEKIQLIVIIKASSHQSEMA